MKTLNKFFLLAITCTMSLAAFAQFPGYKPTPNDKLVSVEDAADGITFRIYAPDAKTVSLGGDLPSWGEKPVEFVKSEEGVWEATFTHKNIGAYRYYFVVDGVRVNDPKAKATVDFAPVANHDPNDDAFWQEKQVPHGAVAQVRYHSTTFDTTRRMHIWTPPSYHKTNAKLPVLYLIHGGGDNDASWAGVGRANFILDNLYAEGKIEPMMVVMPDGSVDVEKFTSEMMKDIILHVEANYNVHTDAAHRAIAGLSMGGLETIETALSHYKDFAYVLPLSTGWFIDSEYYPKWKPILKKEAAKINAAFKLFRIYMGGEEDIAHKNCQEMLKTFDECGIKYEYSSRAGGHTWYVWRQDLWEFAPLLFKL